MKRVTLAACLALLLNSAWGETLPVVANAAPICAYEFSLYETLQASKQQGKQSLWGSIQSEADRVIAEFEASNLIRDQAQVEALRAALRIAPILDNQLFWDAASDILEHRGFKNIQQVDLFVNSIVQGELPAHQVQQIAQEIVAELPKNLPDPNVENLLSVKKLQEFYDIPPDQYKALRAVLSADTPEKKRFLIEGVIGVILFKEGIFAKKVVSRRGFIRERIRSVIRKKANLLLEAQVETVIPEPDPRIALNRQTAVHPELVNRVESSSDATVRLRGIYKFVNDRELIHELDYYYILEHITTNVEWGWKDTNSTLDQSLETSWKKDFAPMDRETLYQTLLKVYRITHCERFRATQEQVLRKLEESYGFGGKNEKYKSENRFRFKQLFDQAIAEKCVAPPAN